MLGFSTTKRNVIGNLLGKVYMALMSFVFVPMYLRLLGPEAYGLIGLYVSLQVIVSLLDMGISPMLTRELARLSASPGNEQESRDLVRTMEAAYWLIGLVIGLCVVLLSPLIAHHFVHANALSPTSIVQAISLVGLIMLFQWPDTFYSGGLAGLQHQVLLNYIRMAFATVQGLGAIFVLRHVSCTIQAYFGWMAFIYAAQTLTLTAFLWLKLPHAPIRARFQRALWGKNAGFMAGMMGVALTAILLTQLDKLTVAASLPLAVFGYYTLATNSANTLALIVGPIFAAVFPRYSQMTAPEDEPRMTAFYHQSCQLLSLLVFPVAVLGFLFSRELLTLYLHNTPEAVPQINNLFRLLLVGNAINALQMLPHGLQLAYGWTKMPLYKNVAGLVFYVPLMLIVVPRYGVMGAAGMWLALNIVDVIMEMPLMHRRLLRGEMWRWYGQDVGLPLTVSLLVGLAARAAAPTHSGWPLLLLWIALSTFAGMAASLAVMPRLWRSALLRRRPEALQMPSIEIMGPK